MSIFKDTFINEVQEQIKKRQEAIHSRTPQTIQYYNSRNAWIRMTSAVEVDGDNGALAKKNILLGGVLSNDKKLRSGIGTSDQAYSTVTTGGNPHRLGIRPMPGITSIDVKSKSAYGSLREVTINFQCWDINQLEELELLYMRPGYTALVEWGWTPYLDNKGALQNGIDFYDSVLNADKTKEQIWEALFQKSKDSNGNYDAMFGYVKNYSWSARTDGGYDCTTTILTLGEVLESLKVNYTPFDNPKVIASGVGLATSQGLAASTLTNMSASYSHNVMAGLFYEMYEIGKAKGEGNSKEGKPYTFTSSGSTYDLFHINININGKENEKNTNIGESDEQVYISMESLVNLLNNYVILKDSTNNSNFIKLSVKEREYDKPTKVTANSTTGDGYLLALAHPLQISIDPTVCLINNPLWIKGGVGVNVNSTEESGDEPSIKYADVSYVNVFNKLIEYGVNTSASANEKNIIDLIVTTTDREINKFKELQRQYLLIKEAVVNRGLNGVPKEMAGVKQSFVNYVKNKKFASFYDLLDDSLTTQEINVILTGKEYSNSTPEETVSLTTAINAITLKPVEADTIELQKIKSQFNDKKDSIKNIKFLSKLPKSYFVNNNYSTELGIIGNIFVNLQMLYSLAIDKNLAAQDKKEKNDINLYDFIKNILSKISSAIGEVNNFELHVDPIDNNIARIIDVNLVDKKSQTETYNNAFEFEIQNTKSIIRSYKLESQIFPEQSSIVAIGAQVGGGALGTDTTTLVDFNKNIRDRIIPTKEAPTKNPSFNSSSVASILAQSLNILYQYFGDFSFSWITDPDFNVDKVNDYKNALKDLINVVRSIEKSKTKNKAIIPTKLSLEIDGIGGLVIGHIFKLPPEVLPKGYRGGNTGSKLGYTVTGIGHSVLNDWVTKIESQTIILDEPTGVLIDYSNINLSINIRTGEATASAVGVKNTGGGSVNEDSEKYPVLVKFHAYKSSFNSTVQEKAVVSNGKTPVADALRTALDKNYIIEKDNELSSSGDITEALKTAVLTFQSKIKGNKAGFGFVKSTNPLVITAGNDNYHRTYGDKNNKTTHCRGLAIDIRTQNLSDAEIQSIMTTLKDSGFVFVIYHGGTALHIHANVNTN
jgi:hypothetical protein